MSTATLASGILNLASVVVAIFSYSSAVNLKQRITNSCICMPNKQSSNEDCDMNKTSKTGYLTSLISVILAVLGFVSVLFIFGQSKFQK
jgi:hypothetical protein